MLAAYLISSNLAIAAPNSSTYYRYTNTPYLTIIRSPTDHESFMTDYQFRGIYDLDAEIYDEV